VSAEKKYTDRELIESERAAFLAGINAKPSIGDPWRGAACEAAARYPMPKVKRQRIVTEKNGRQWRFDDTHFHTRSAIDRLWMVMGDRDGPTLSLTVERVELWADLLENPTEEVEE
jgi:hypothetical protein